MMNKSPSDSNPGQEITGMRLNKYLAKGGIASRRQCAELIKSGLVQVNGEILTNPGYQVQDGDQISYQGKKILPQEQKIYLLLNKPKNTITSVRDEKGRKTVIDILGEHIDQRVFPVGRLDRNTTGLLIITNDGDLANKLAHPKFEVKKIYHAKLDKPLNSRHLQEINAGFELEDGPIQVDEASYLKDRPKDEVGISIHIGRNRIVRRIFEHFGYEVVKLDRVYYAGLTKKDIPRGRYRHLSEQEVIMLKHFI